eukprot:CAMPEP_0184855546 /NCGR_PEP_ID=MMETSP0580-20130426/762_1 /TAXON_ID=1118495 /ORGANISM="Dactyliosolen fragilissimus" /LENGTH=620 /DNA_ID=CAMNT_0027350087 /DNA_START=74 /DNA_END=1937 /DNA_ORIENTATION=+
MTSAKARPRHTWLCHLIQVALMTLLLSSSSITPIQGAASGKCASGLTFDCPNCGGIQVTDCLDCDGYLNADEVHKICFKRKLFNDKNTDGDHDEHYRYLLFDILGTFVWFFAAGIATACGVGGGGIYVPLGIILLRFSSKPASGLSQASIFGASLGGLILNIRNKHPNSKIPETAKLESGRITEEMSPDMERRYVENGGKFYGRPLIDYDMALFLAPMEMAGAVLGVLIQRLLPNWLFLSIAGVILAYTSYKTFKKFFSAYKIDKEKKQKRLEAERYEAEDEENKPQEADKDEIFDEEGESNTDVIDAELIKSEADGTVSNIEESPVSDIKEVSTTNVPEEKVDAALKEDNFHHDEKSEARKKFLELDNRQFPREKLIYLIILWIGLAIITFMKGGKGVDSIVGITCKDAMYPILLVFQFLWTLGFAGIFGFKLLKNQSVRAAVDYPFLPNDVIWDTKKDSFYAFFTFVAGIVAGLIGIGGGMVLGPLMLVMGIHPRVSTATTATMIVLTSSSVAVMFVTSGLVPWSYALYFFCICFVGAYIGKKYIDAYVKRTGMASILIGILACIIGFATIGCFVIVLLNLGRANWCFDGFKSFCTIKDDDELCPNRRMELDFMNETF